MKIGTKLLSSILGIVFLGAAGSTYWVTNLMEKAMFEGIKEQQNSSVTFAAREIDSKIKSLQQILYLANNSTHVRDILQQPDDEKLAKIAGEYLKRVSALAPEVLSIGLIDPQGLVRAATVEENVGKRNLSDRDYFKAGMQGRAKISDPSISRSTGQPSIFIAAPVEEQGIVRGVMYMTVDLSLLGEETLKHVRIGKNGYTFMSASPGKTLYHPEKDRIFEDTSGMPWMQDMFRVQKGYFEYSFDNIKYLTGLAVVPSTGWLLTLTATREDVLGPLSTIRTAGLTSMIAMILVVFVVVIMVVRSITKALEASVKVAEGVAAGNLNQNTDISRKDELGTLGRALDTMMGKLRDMISTSENKTREAEAATARAEQAVTEAEAARRTGEKARREGLLEAASRLELIVQQLNVATKELERRAEQSAQGANSQLARAAETSTAMEQMNSSVLEIARSASQAAEASDTAKQQAVSGSQVVRDVVSSIGEMRTKTQAMSDKLNSLGEHAAGIGAIMSVISDIADQTNLLALNAAIEAARAGEAGRGFAVVADEVRKLAEKTMTATRQVGDAVNSIQQGTESSISAMNDTGQVVERSTELATSAGESLKRIVAMVENSADQVRAIATSSEEQSAASEQVNRGTDEINSIAMESADSARRAVKAVADLSELARQMGTVVQDLKNS